MTVLVFRRTFALQRRSAFRNRESHPFPSRDRGKASSIESETHFAGEHDHAIGSTEIYKRASNEQRDRCDCASSKEEGARGIKLKDRSQGVVAS